jgi:hypothetical protein
VWQLIDLGFDNVDDYYVSLRKQWFNNIKNLFKILESNGVKCLLLSITDDYSNLLNNDIFMKNRFIELEYDNKKFDNFIELFTYDKTLQIKYDYNFFGNNTPNDLHPSMYCHQIVANSIIKKIQENEKI